MKRFFLLVSAVLAMTFMANAQVIDFETGDFSQFAFDNTSSYPWTIVAADNGSQYCMSSSNAGVSSSTSSISATVDFTAAGYVSFDALCQGEGTSTFWDHCDFAIDGTTMFTCGANVSGWQTYLYEVEAGEHTFVWSYTKDSSVNPTGDAMKVDNVVFGVGTPCVAPTAISAVATPSSATVTWNGAAETFTLRYRLSGVNDWTVVEDLEETSYTISGLEAGEYEVEVQADCATSEWATGSFTVVNVESTANWYGNAAYFSGESWNGNFVSFTMHGLDEVSVAASGLPSSYAATYANGYVWFITTNDAGNALYKAPLDNENTTIGSATMLVNGFVSNTTRSMAYNPVDEKIYLLSGSELISFPVAAPVATTVGTLPNTNTVMTIAINNEGEAYGVEYTTGDFYSINLETAATTLVGSTGLGCAYVQDMSFDTETNELFWAQYGSDGSHGLYMVNPENANVTFLGQIGGNDGGEMTSMFMAVGNTLPTTISDLIVEGFTAPRFNQNPNFNVMAPLGARYEIDEVNWYKDGEAMSEGDVFDDESANYYMSVEITLEEGFEFDENVTVYFGGSAEVCDADNSHVVDASTYYAQTIAFQVFDATIFDFEDGTTQGWISLDADGDGNGWEMGSNPVSYFVSGTSLAGTGHESSEDFVLSGSYTNVTSQALTPDNYLVSPSRDFYTNISFWACAQDAQYPAEHFGVAVATVENPSASDFTTIQEWTLTAKGSGVKSVGRSGETRAQGNWYQFSVDLSEYDGEQIWVAIRHFNCSDQFVLNIDDIEVAKYDAVVENDANALTIYPNPTSDRVVITSEATVNEYSIYNVTGAVVMSNKVNAETFEVNVESMPAGLYTIRIYGEGFVQTKKFIVK